MTAKYTLTKGDQVKRTKSAALVALLEKQGWKRETSGGDKPAPAGKPAKGAKKGDDDLA